MNYKNLAETYGTPLYIYNVDEIKKRILEFKQYFKSSLFPTEIAYASKAFSIKAMLRLIFQLDLSLDVVSLGELYTALKVDFDLSKIYFHGNNKSIEELDYAIRHHVGTIVVDNLEELKRIDELAKRNDTCVSILIRLNVGVEAHTHEYIVTAHVDSKFGVLYQSLEYEAMMSLLSESHNIKLMGFHAHIGSQIFDLSAYAAEIEKLLMIGRDFSYPLVYDLGGGFGAKYTDQDRPISCKEISEFLISCVEQKSKELNVAVSKLIIEPGRSIVCEAGSTLYTIGAIKKTPHRLYYFIDGGMTDNIRPALYHALYQADIVGKEQEFKNKMVTVAGKCCESGDLIIEHTPLQRADVGDLLVVYSTGAYGYAMGSNYNKALIPAVVFVENEKPKLVVHRQTLEELLEREE